MCLQVSSDAVHKLKPSRPEAAADSQNHDLRPLSHQLVRQWRGQGARVPQTPAETCGQVCFFVLDQFYFYIISSGTDTIHIMHQGKYRMGQSNLICKKIVYDDRKFNDQLSENKYIPLSNYHNILQLV
jgi:hypothetical protein